MTSRYWSWLALGAVVFCRTAPGRADESEFSPATGAARLIDPRATLVVEFDRLSRLAEHPLVRAIVENLGRSRELKARMESPEFDRLRQAYDLLSAASGEEPVAALGRLSAGGMALSVNAKPGTPPELTLAVVADDVAWLQKTVESLQAKLLARLPAERRPAALPTETYRGHTLVKAGDAGYVLDGTQFVAANTLATLKRAVDRIVASQPSERRAQADHVTDAAQQESPVARARLDLAALRADPKFAQGVAMPSDDIGRIVFLAGWTELLRRADTVSASLTHDAGGLSLRLSAPVAREQIAAATPGFFASRPETRPLPPLRVPEAIASFSWYRDYGALWAARDRLLTEAARKRLEEGNEKAAKQFEVVGGRFLPHELAALMGPHYRVVVARQQQTAYPVKLTEKLPAAALAFDIRDEFREKLQPILKFVGLIGNADNNRYDTHLEQHDGNTLTSLRTRGDDSQYKTNRIRYQFSPTWSFAHGHFVVGSTTEVVRQAIDALKAERSPGKDASRVPADATEIQIVSAKAAATALDDFRRALIDGAVLQNGLSPEDAAHELDVLSKAIEALGTLTATTTVGEKELGWHLRIGR